MTVATPKWTTTLDDLVVDTVETAAGPVEAAICGPAGAPAVLLIHGIPGSWRQCVPLAEDLADAFRVILPSRPGYGWTPITTGRSYDEQADASAALLDAFGVEDAAVLGISGGGPIAVALAARHHARVRALVMACAMAPHLTKVPLAMRLVRVPWLAEFLGPRLRERDRRNAADPQAVEDALREGLTAHEYEQMKADPRIREDLVRHSTSHLEAPHGLVGLRNDLACVVEAQRNGPPDLGGVRCPTLLMYGDADAVIGPEHAEHYARAVPHAEFAVFDNSGHVFALTRRAEASAAIRCLFERTA